jgi:hypothetical protein
MKQEITTYKLDKYKKEECTDESDPITLEDFLEEQQIVYFKAGQKNHCFDLQNFAGMLLDDRRNNKISKSPNTREPISNAVRNMIIEAVYTEDLSDIILTQRFLNAIENEDEIELNQITPILSTMFAGKVMPRELLQPALFNVNIIVYLSNGTKLLYKADEYKSIYQEGKFYNIDKTPITIELGYYSNYHYLGIVESDIIDLDKDVYEEMDNYFYITVEDNNENLYDIDILFSDDVQPLGFYNTKTGKIEYFQFENELEDELFEKVSEILEYIDSPDDDERMKKITYMKNIENNKVYLDKDGDKIEIGIIKLNSRNQSYISF